MVPKTSARRRSKERDPERPTSRANLINFQKPNLPPLQGTPSGRRQYSYGAGPEPLPSRLGRPVDLVAAVRGVLTRQDEFEEEQDEQNDESDPTRQTRQPSYPAEDEEDELAGSEVDYRPRPSTADQRAERTGSHLNAVESLRPAPRGWTPDGSETDDARSFVMENDYYGEATIDSSPRSVPPPTSTFLTSKPPLSLKLAGNALQSAEPENSTRIRNLAPENDSEDANTRPSVPPEADSDLHDRHRRSRPREDAVEEQHNSNEDGVDASTASKRTWTNIKNLLGGNNTLAPASPPESEAQLSPGAGAARPASEASRMGSQPSRSERRRLGAQQAADHGDTNKDQPQDPRRQLRISSDNPGMGIFSRASERASALSPLTTVSRYRSDHSEMDDAIRDIQGAEAETRREKWRQKWADTFRPWRQLRPPGEREVHGLDDGAINLWQLLNPLTHLQALVWFLNSIVDKSTSALSRICTDPVRQHIALFGGSFLYLIAGTLTILMAIALSRVAIAKLPIDLADFVAVPKVSTSSWTGFGAITSKIGDYIPSIPWSSRSPWDDFPGLANLSDRQHAQLEDWLKNIDRELRLLKEARKLHEASIKKLETVVPKLVHMNLKNGKPVVAQEFWHAIRDLIHQDGSFLTFEKKKGGVYEVSSERQWKAIAAQLAKDPAFTSRWNLGLREMEDRLNGKMPFFWDTWVANNQRKIAQMLGPRLDKMKPADSQKELDERLDDRIKKHLANDKADGVVVTREEFLRHLNNEFATHRAEMKAEIGELQPKLEQLVRESVELANNDVPSGMTRPEVEKLVSGLVRKAIADANLEAMAKGRIHAHWDQVLKNQVNYFGIGAGAIVDGKHTSKTFKPDEATLELKGLQALKPKEGIAALEPWLDEGDCWCGTRDVNKRGNPHGVYLTVVLAQTIIPQHIVIDHILPGATVDPGARPKHIEVYASIEDTTVRERVLDFASAHFPDDEEDWNFTPSTLPPRFVKIGQFIYEGAELHDGVFVHRLSSELTALGAETEQIAVRAVSNYGAEKYTCFYRVRLFGDTVETPSIE